MNIFKIKTPDRPWYTILIWWELRRILFNIILYFVGLASFYIGYVTIPLLYIIIGLVINAGYTLGWVVELGIIRKKSVVTRMKYPRIAFFSYLVVSVLSIIGFAFLLMLLP